MTRTVPLLQHVLRDYIRDIPDFPKPGVTFKDIAPLLRDPGALATVVDALVALGRQGGATKVAGIEARGFLLAAPVAYGLSVGVVPVRKAGKLPGDTIAADYELEYGSATLEVQRDALSHDERVLLVDDVLATGGTAATAAALLERVGGTVLGLAVLLELTFLPGRERVAPLPVHSLLPI